MSGIVPELRTATFTVAAVGTNETKAIFRVRAGDIILAMSVVLKTVLGSGTTETTTIGDGDDVDGYGTNTEMDAEGTLGAITQLGTEALGYAMPKIYSADDTIDIVYTAGDAAGAAPAWRVTMLMVEGARA